MTRAEQKDATRERLLREAARLLAERGYADVSISDIAGAAGVTKGAVYHQFAGKAELLEAVVAQLLERVGDAVASAADAEVDALDALVAGCRAFLVATTAPEVRRVILLDAPATLGWERWRQLDDATSAVHLREALRELVDARVLRSGPVEPLARLLSGAMNEAALWLARPGAGPDDLDEALAWLASMLSGLRPPP